MIFNIEMHESSSGDNELLIIRGIEIALCNRNDMLTSIECNEI